LTRKSLLNSVSNPTDLTGSGLWFTLAEVCSLRVLSSMTTCRKHFDKHQLTTTLWHRKFPSSSDWGCPPQDPNWLQLWSLQNYEWNNKHTRSHVIKCVHEYIYVKCSHYNLYISNRYSKLPTSHSKASITAQSRQLQALYVEMNHSNHFDTLR